MQESRDAAGRVDWLDSLRGMAIVMVVAMHSAGYVPIYERDASLSLLPELLGM